MTIEERLETLERRLAGYRVVALVVVVLGAGSALTAWRTADPRCLTADVIRAHQFLLLDPTGRTRGEWTVRDETARLSLLGPEGRLCGVLLNADGQESGLWLATDHPTTQSIQFAVRSPAGAERMAAGFENADSRPTGTYRDGIPLAEMRMEALKSSGANGEIWLRMDQKGEPSIELGYWGCTRACLGHTSLRFPKTGSTESRPASSLVLFGPDGTVIERLPR